MGPPPNSKRLRLWGTEHGSAVASLAAHYVSTGYGTKKTVHSSARRAYSDGHETTRHVRHYLQRYRIKSRKILYAIAIRRNTHPRKGDQEQGERRHLDPSLRSATSSHEPWSRNFQDTVLAQTPNPRRDEVSLRGLLQRQNGGGLKAEVRLEVRGHLPYNSTFLHPSLASLSPRLFPPSASSSGRLPLPVPHPATLLKLALRLRPARKPAASKTSK